MHVSIINGLSRFAQHQAQICVEGCHMFETLLGFVIHLLYIKNLLQVLQFQIARPFSIHFEWMVVLGFAIRICFGWSELI